MRWKRKFVFLYRKGIKWKNNDFKKTTCEQMCLCHVYDH